MGRAGAWQIARFTTAMTGALIRTHGVLAAQLDGAVTLGNAFREAVAAGSRRDLAASLFGIRAAGLPGRRDDADAASFASGLLIGADVAARLAGDTVHILADGNLGTLYAGAVETQGRTARVVDSHTAFVAGIVHLGALVA